MQSKKKFGFCELNYLFYKRCTSFPPIYLWIKKLSTEPALRTEFYLEGQRRKKNTMSCHILLITISSRPGSNYLFSYEINDTSSDII